MTERGAAAAADGAAAGADWRSRAVERSLHDARERAEARSERFMAVAVELLTETGRTDFTLQELVRRAGLSLRAFYQHFSGKDELLLAVFEEAIRSYTDQVGRRLAAEPDPVRRLCAFIDDLYAIADPDVHGDRLLSQALTVFHLKLATVRPDDVQRALEPQVELTRQIVAAGVEAGVFRTDVDPGRLAMILTQTLVGVGHMNVLGTHVTGVQIEVEDLVAFCLAAVGADPAAAGPRSGRSRRRPPPPTPPSSPRPPPSRPPE